MCGAFHFPIISPPPLRLPPVRPRLLLVSSTLPILFYPVPPPLSASGGRVFGVPPYCLGDFVAPKASGLADYGGLSRCTPPPDRIL